MEAGPLRKLFSEPALQASNSAMAANIRQQLRLSPSITALSRAPSKELLQFSKRKINHDLICFKYYGRYTMQRQYNYQQSNTSAGSAKVGGQ